MIFTSPHPRAAVPNISFTSYVLQRAEKHANTVHC